MSRVVKAPLAIALLIIAFTSAFAHGALNITVSHEWPDTGRGQQASLQHLMFEVFAKELEEQGNTVRIYGDSGLFEPWEQWSALASSAVDISMFPLVYAANRHPEFNLTFMPGLIRDYEHLERFNTSAAMDEIRGIIRQAGVVVLADLWVTGGFVSKTDCVLEPQDVRGQWISSMSVGFNEMLATAGAHVDSMPVSQVAKMMKAAEGGLDMAVMSSPDANRFLACDTHEQCPVKCVTVPGTTPLWFMYQPLLMSRTRFEALTEPEQAAIREAARQAKRYWDAQSRMEDALFANRFAVAGVEVKKLSGGQRDDWRRLAERSLFHMFRDFVPSGARLLDMATDVE